MTDHADLAAFYRRYGEASFAADEPVYAEICLGIAERPELLSLLASHAREARQPNLIFAAVHYLVLGGIDHDLADLYYGTGTADPSTAFADLVLTNRAEIDELLRTRRTQTNEVGRCAVLALMLDHAQRLAGTPLGWIDLGTSGGLNLQLDHFRVDYDLGSRTATTGPNDAPLRLRSELRSGRPEPPSAHAAVAWRIGIDRAPVDVTDEHDARWLQACLWPSNRERADRLRAAIEVAVTHPPRLLQAEAVAGVTAALEAAPADLTLVMTTTWVWYYLPRQVQQQVLAAVQASGRRVLWYSLEGAGVVAELEEPRDRHAVESTMGFVQIGAGGVEAAQVLGVSHPHGTWMTWR